MKINGVILDKPEPEVIVIPKGKKEFVFKADAVLDYTEFESLCPRPKPPVILKKGGKQELNIEDETYNEKVAKWCGARINWMIITSLKATPDLEWETIDAKNPETWGNYEKELLKFFPDKDVQRIIEIVFVACGLNQNRIDEATERFLAGQGQE